MKIASYNYSLRARRGFTLLELLVVITIIGVLAGILFPAANSVMRKAEMTHAETTCANLRTSINAYFTEYRKFPVEPGTNESTPLRTDSTLMDVLLGADNNDLNARKIAFYTDKQAKRAPEAGKYRKGITLEADGGGELWDPWGDYYYVVMDLDYNNRVERPSWDTSGDSTVLPEPVLVWSAGKDQNEQTAKDNVKSW